MLKKGKMLNSKEENSKNIKVNYCTKDVMNDGPPSTKPKEMISYVKESKQQSSINS